MSPTTSITPPSAPPAADQPAIGLSDPARFLNRDLQWLAFNERVLWQAMDDRNPLLERVRFLAIFASNLDEFFQKRVGSLHRDVADTLAATYDGLSPSRHLELIRDRVQPLLRRKAECFRNQILPALREAGIELLDYAQLTDSEKTQVEHWFRKNVFPILTPLAVDPGHRFPFISNLSVSLGVLLRRPGESGELFARVKVPPVVAQWHRLHGSNRFVPLQQIIEHNLDDLFPGMEILKVMSFRVTRNADVDERESEDAEDLVEEIRAELRERRFAPVVRLQVLRKPPRTVLNFVTEELGIAAQCIYECDDLLNDRSLSEIADLDMPALRYNPWTPVTPARLVNDEKDIFSVIREADVLVHHPYESFNASVERFIKEAAADPNVLCIKQALYRTSGESPFIPELIRAAESGKQVAVLVELRARFDEDNNILWARKLEDAGVHVAYGVVGLKTHTKIALVVRRESGGIRCYAHIGTGNYHSRTARHYADIGLLTCNHAITEDLIYLFNYLTGRSRQSEYNKLLVAPVTMKKRFLELIEREIKLHTSENPGRIVAKMNQLQDREVIDALYRASQAGVQVDLIVRGFCTLRPGIPGLSDNIRVGSIIGRFLEHSRIFWFKNASPDPLEGDFFIGSADWMYRNLHARVEAVCPVEDRALRKRLWQVLQTCLDDRRTFWDMDCEGRYTLRMPVESDTALATVGAQQALMDLTLQALREPELTD